MTPRHAFTGKCRFCRCTSGEDEPDACNLPTGGKCHWIDYERTVCSNPPCVRAWEKERAQIKAEQRERNRKRTPPEIEALKREERRVRRRKSREKAGAA